MNKVILAAALSVAALSTIGSAIAAPEYVTVCTSINANNSDVPSGTYVDANGRKWTGYKADGTVSDSLTSSGGTSTSCVTVENNIG